MPISQQQAMTLAESCASTASKVVVGGGPSASGQFPDGMRVLAVDDDPVCLKLLESLLRRCRYHVTTTNQAVVALKLLRENKDSFDLVITDVHMPDMDGFKLLELLGLEMDLPVIMLSANSDPKAVMQGVTHGACDYLLKPVRIQELKIIWQHVVRRWKSDPKDHLNYDHGDGDKPGQPNAEDGRAAHSDRGARLNRKRKDQNKEDDGDDCGDAGHENDDPSASQKKQKVVWTADLHRKFVAAVNHLGVDKATPEKILDLMNEENLTRRNVASHLQKYRLCLNKISLANQQANVDAALGFIDATSMPMGYFDDRQNYHVYAGSGQLSTPPPFQQHNMLGRLNGETNSGMYGIGSSGAVQLGYSQNRGNNNAGDTGKLSNISFSGMTQNNLLQGAYTSLEFNQLQQQQAMLGLSSPWSCGFSEARISVATPGNSFLNTINNNQMMQLLPQMQQLQQLHALVLPPFAGMASLRADPFEMTKGASSYLPDLSRCNDNCPAAASSSGYPPNFFPTNVPFSQNTLGSNDLKVGVPPMTSSIDVDPRRASKAHLHNTAIGSNFHSQVDSLGGNMPNMSTNVTESPGFPDIRSTDYAKLSWQEQRQNQMQKLNHMYQSTLDPTGLDNGLNDAAAVQDRGLINRISTNKAEANVINQPQFNNPFYPQNGSFGRTSSNSNIKFNDDYISDPTKLQGSLNSNGYSTFDDLMNAMPKREWEDGDVNL